MIWFPSWRWMLWFKNDFDSTNYLKILFLMFFVIYRWHRGSTHRDSAGRIPGQSSLLYPWCLFVCLICIYLFSLWLCWVFVAAYGLSLAVASRATLYLGCSGFSLPWLLSLWSMRSRARRLQWLQHVGSLVEAHGPSCPAACGIFPDQGLNHCPLHCNVDS